MKKRRGADSVFKEVGSEGKEGFVRGDLFGAGHLNGRKHTQIAPKWFASSR